MNIFIELGGPLAEAINNLASALVSAKQADIVIEKASEKAAKRNRKADVPAEAPAETPAPEAAAAEAPAPEAAPQPAEPAGPSRDDAKKAILKVAKEKGHDAAAALLKRFGATKISEVKDEDIASIIKDAEAL